MINQTNQHKRTNVITKATEAINERDNAKANGRTELGQVLGLVLSSLFTVIYMVVALGGGLIEFGWSNVAAYMIGGLLGVAAIMPGEAGVWVWKTKLKADAEINDTQVFVAWAAGLSAAISAAISTVSFFAYLLQPLMPGWYNPETASGINVVNIAVGWAIFCIAVFVYSASGDAAKHNKERAKALNLIRDSKDRMIAGIAGGVDSQTEKVLAMMDQQGLFLVDALHEVGETMGLSNSRMDQIIAKIAEQETAVTPPPQPEAKPKPSFRPYSAPATDPANGVGRPSGD
ncbi:MAG: hypothetical protein HC804_12115 [Anaerolineae bacterium]|nr:hypothetical protein [Anaerolineae bacterium]